MSTPLISDSSIKLPRGQRRILGTVASGSVSLQLSDDNTNFQELANGNFTSDFDVTGSFGADDWFKAVFTDAVITVKQV